MDIQTQSTAAAAQPNPSPAADREGSSALSSDFETFLLMLTTQMQNQDPLNPIESQDFAVQLATFSGVEQQVLTNELLETLATGMGLSGMSQLAGWVGMEARVTAPAAFDGTPITLAPDPDPAADGATLIVRDALNNVVSREAVPIGGGNIQWAGVDGAGAPLPAGLYSFELESLNQGQVTSTRPVEHYALVDEARQSASGVEIVLRGGAAVASSDVSALRRPSAPV
ncbi:MAG: flagellar hook assembly protein FlgD [Silicimonas sp.]|nr:flagellar hook assembly protein FlgD [Silicimonas sp.]